MPYNLVFRNRRQEKEPEEEDNDQGEEIETSQKIKTYKDANMYLEEVQEFLEQEGYVEEAFKLGSIMALLSPLERLSSFGGSHFYALISLNMRHCCICNPPTI